MNTLCDVLDVLDATHNYSSAFYVCDNLET